ncbi:MAG: TIGR03960 family B12-binding radical SAM protein [Oscillospiraceae bacterium]|nr:TIGR03960 family B12-binding radical SAM protein [Oscillospiraceae bacterium]
MDKRLERILPRVQKPARYTGGEYGQILKDRDGVDIRLAFCFPDTYEIGMSNLGMSILYETMNSLPFVWCERVFAPWGDMAEEMKKAGMPLYALESGDSLDRFDSLAFSVGYEMAYTTVLDMLDMAGIPLRSADRPDLLPLIWAGGTAAVNAEPMAPFMDLFVIGEGEDLDNEVLALLRDAKLGGWSKHEFLMKAARIQGVYVPSLYDVSYNADGTVAAVTPRDGAPARIVKRIVQDLDAAPYPTHPIVPSTEVIHDRVSLELFRGCPRGCRFCQAGHVYRPLRAKKPETLIRQGIESLESTGHEDVTLLSLSTSDYRQLPALCDGLLAYCEPRSIGLSLPSLRADNFSMEIMERLQKVRKSGLTFAVEGGSQRLRDAVNKNVTQEDVLHTCSIAFAGGWNAVKLYYMLGLPTETDEDVLGIARMADEILQCWRMHAKNKARGVKITISTSCFIPKPHSPFQWEAQIQLEEYLRRVNLLRSAITARNVTYNWHDAETSLIEAVLSKGDRRVADAIEEVWRQGGRLDAWSDYFSFQRWIDAFEKCGVDLDFYAHRVAGKDEILPWDHIDVGVRKAHLWSEREKCYRSELSPDCRHACAACGAAKLLTGGIRCDER